MALGKFQMMHRENRNVDYKQQILQINELIKKVTCEVSVTVIMLPQKSAPYLGIEAVHLVLE